MLNLLFLILGFLLAHLISQKPIQIVVHHKQENINPIIKDVDMDELQKEMLKEDPKLDDEYDKLGDISAEVNEIMMGSDR